MLILLLLFLGFVFCEWDLLPITSKGQFNLSSIELMAQFAMKSERALDNRRRPCWKFPTAGSAGEFMCLPDVYGIGPMKTGTTFVWTAIQRLASVFAKGNQAKEVYFWEQFAAGSRYEDGRLGRVYTFENYTHEYAVASQNVQSNPQLHLADFTALTVNSCPSPHSAASAWTVPEAIKSLVPDAKLLVVLRNPVDRAISETFYTNKWNYNTSKELPQLAGFKRMILQAQEIAQASDSPADLTSLVYPKNSARRCWPNPVAKSAYIFYLKDWVSVFPHPESWFITTFEEVTGNCVRFLKSFVHFLGNSVTDDELQTACQTTPTNVNTHSKPPPENSRDIGEMKRKLETFFVPFNRMLANFLENKKLMSHDLILKTDWLMDASTTVAAAAATTTATVTSAPAVDALSELVPKFIVLCPSSTSLNRLKLLFSAIRVDVGFDWNEDADVAPSIWLTTLGNFYQSVTGDNDPHQLLKERPSAHTRLVFVIESAPPILNSDIYSNYKAKITEPDFRKLLYQQMKTNDFSILTPSLHLLTEAFPESSRWLFLTDHSLTTSACSTVLSRLLIFTNSTDDSFETEAALKLETQAQCEIFAPENRTDPANVHALVSFDARLVWNRIFSMRHNLYLPNVVEWPEAILPHAFHDIVRDECPNNFQHEDRRFLMMGNYWEQLGGGLRDIYASFDLAVLLRRTLVDPMLQESSYVTGTSHSGVLFSSMWLLEGESQMHCGRLFVEPEQWLRAADAKIDLMLFVNFTGQVPGSFEQELVRNFRTYDVAIESKIVVPGDFEQLIQFLQTPVVAQKRTIALHHFQVEMPSHQLYQLHFPRKSEKFLPRPDNVIAMRLLNCALDQFPTNYLGIHVRFEWACSKCYRSLPNGSAERRVAAISCFKNLIEAVRLKLLEQNETRPVFVATDLGQSSSMRNLPQSQLLSLHHSFIDQISTSHPVIDSRLWRHKCRLRHFFSISSILESALFDIYSLAHAQSLYYFGGSSLHKVIRDVRFSFFSSEATNNISQVAVDNLC